MAAYTILRNSVKNNRSDVVVEFDVPVSNNDAGVGWRSVVTEERLDAGETGTVNTRKRGYTAHIAKLDAGKIVEILMSVEYNANLTDSEKLAVIDAAVTAKVAEFTAEFGSLYRFYGTTRTV